MTIPHFTEVGPEAPGPRWAGLVGQPAPPPSEAGHRPSHLQLLARVPHYGSGPEVRRLPLSGVLVPTCRPSTRSGGGLGLAARLAEAKDAQLIVVRSGPAVAGPFPRSMVPETTRPMVVIDLPDQVPDLPLRRRTGGHVVDTLHRDNDLGFKRNVGLLLGTLCGWQSLLMLDDDISTRPAAQIPARPVHEPVHPQLRLDDVLADFATYPELRAAGYLQKDFDDNSVVCHARRLAGHRQEGFISGGALVVRLADDLPFFPATYNEDWLFFFSLMVQGTHSLPSSTVKYVGPVHQRAYYPYSAVRARSEEVGDVLAEGLFNLLGRSRAEIFEVASTVEYWEQVIWERHTMIISLLSELRSGSPGATRGVAADADAALRASLVVVDCVPGWAEELAGYVQALLWDIEDWQELLEGLEPHGATDGLDVESAVSLLGLAPYARLVGGGRRRRWGGVGGDHLVAL